jgi:hypothetical protein
VGGKKSTRQTQRQKESLRQVFLTFLRNAEFQNRFLELRDSKQPTKNNPIPEDLKLILSGKCFQFGNEISDFRSAEHKNTSQ